MGRLFALMLSVALLFPGADAAGAALSAQPATVQYTRAVWRVPEGLPEDTVQALAESTQGLLWIGTTGGLARFDGSRLQMYDAGHTNSSVASSIFCLLVSRDGSLWAGTEGSGLLHIQGDTAKAYASAEGLTDSFVRSVFEDSRGRLWVGTDSGLFFKNGPRFERWRTGNNAQPLAVHSITEDHEHRLWVGGSSLLSIDAAGREQDYTLPGAYSENRVKRILQTSDGTLWVGTVRGLQRFRHGHFQIVPGIAATVRALQQTSDGTLWIGTIGAGLWTLHSGANGSEMLTHVSRPSLLPSETVLSIFQDDQHQVWVGTQAGLVRLSQTPVSLVTLPEGGDPDFETISGDAHGDVWVAAQRLYRIRNGVAKPIAYGSASPHAVRNIFRAHDGALWIGTDGGGAYRIRMDGATTHFTAPAQLTNNFIRGFLEARDGTLWIACDEGVSLIGPGGIRKLTEAEGLAYFSTRSLLQDRNGSLWVGTDRGLSHWVNGAFRQDVATRTLAQEKVWSILQDRMGAVWFGTREHGLFRLSDGAMRRFTTAEGLPANSIYQLLQDRRGTFWITGPNSIASVQGSALEDNAPSAANPLSVTVYSMPFGAEGAQLYGGRQPAGYLAPDDSVWFPTNRGAAHISAVRPVTGPGPRAYLADTREDGQAVNANGSQLEIPAHVSRISFSFSAAFLRGQEGLRFRYRLEGFDKAWNLAGSNREATYTNLPAGHYRLRVVAFDIAAPEQVSEVDLAVNKRPFFYQTWWSYTGCVGLLAALAWTLYQLRLRQMHARFSAVLQERSRLAREMHDTVIQGCTGISALLEAVAITPADDGITRDELLGLAREQARSTVGEARQVVWDMRHEQEGDVDMVSALRKLAAQNQRESAAAVAFTSGLERLDVKASVAHEVLMTVREAITNALQHSGSPVVQVEIRLRGPELAVIIADQGCGLPAMRPDCRESGHYGILGMRERTERVGGTLMLASTPGEGTRVEMIIARSRLCRSVPRN